MSIGQPVGNAFLFRADRDGQIFPESVDGFTRTDLLQLGPDRVALAYNAIASSVIEFFDPVTGAELRPNAYLSEIGTLFGVQTPIEIENMRLLDLPGDEFFLAGRTIVPETFGPTSSVQKLALNVIGDDGVPRGAEIEISSGSDRLPNNMTVQRLSDGGILVSWEYQSDGFAYQVYDTNLSPRYANPIEIPGPARGLYSPITFLEQGDRLALHYLIETYDIRTRLVSSEPRIEFRDMATGVQIGETVAPTASDVAGLFALARSVATSRTSDGGLLALFPLTEGGSTKYYVERYNADGTTHQSVFTPREIDFGVPLAAAGLETSVARKELKIVPLVDGGYAIVFLRTDDPTKTMSNNPDTDIHMVAFDANEARILASTRLNQDHVGRQGGFDAEVLSDGDLMLSYYSLNGGGEYATVQRFSLALPEPDPDQVLLGSAKVADTLTGGTGDDLLLGDGRQAGYAGDSAARVFRLYQATLDRAPDRAGQIDWTDRLETGIRTLREVAEGFVGSDEFQRVYGALSDTGFVELLYQNVLGRAADAGGLANWTGKLAGGTSRAEVVTGFSESAEFISATRAAAASFARDANPANWSDEVYRLYQATLDREPDAGGLLNWTGRLADGRALTSVIEGFTGSAEFQATYGALDDSAFVNLLYQNVLDRLADTGGLADWTGRLADGTSRAEVVRGFSESAEFIAKTAAGLATWIRAQGTQDVLTGGAGDDTLAGGEMADRFVFDADHQGADRVLDLEAWDTLVFTGFGFADDAAARAAMTQAGADVLFDAGGVSVTLVNTQLAQISDAMIELG